MRPTWTPKGALEASKRPLGAESCFRELFGVILDPPKSSNMELKFNQKSSPLPWKPRVALKNLRGPRLANASPPFKQAPAPLARTQFQGSRSCFKSRGSKCVTVQFCRVCRDFGSAKLRFVPRLSPRARQKPAFPCVVTRFQGTAS